jgi:hypothetical protein
MFNFLKKSISLSLVSSIILLSGCGSSDNPPAATSSKATFVDAVIEGLSYKCGSNEGVTNDNGEFEYIQGSTCTFILGQSEFLVEAENIEDGIVTPYDIGSNDAEVELFARILYSLSDSETSYSRQINETKVAKMPNISLSDSVESIEEKMNEQLIALTSADVAMEHLNEFVSSDGKLITPLDELKSGIENSYSSRFPNLAKAFDLEEYEFTLMVGKSADEVFENNTTDTITRSVLAITTTGKANCAGVDITQDGIKDMGVGSRIYSSCSKFDQYPIFDLGALQSDGAITQNEASSEAVSTLKITSSKTASSSSNQQNYDFAASGSALGFKGSSAYHQVNAYNESSDSGKTTVMMSHEATGNSVQMQISQGTDESYYDLTEYLIGNALSDEEIAKYISYDEEKMLLKATVMNKFGTDSVIPYSQKAYYQNAQFIQEMINIFGILKEQYNSDENIKNRFKIRSLMFELKEKIYQAIELFVSMSGDSFVSKINQMNMAYASGSLQFHDDAGSRSSQYQAGISASYSAIFASGSTEDSVQINKQNGWANSYSNTEVSAQSFPVGVVDTDAWLSTINSALKDESKPLVAPVASLAAAQNIPTLTPPELKKDPNTPPDSVFNSYKEWKDYKDGLKDDAEAESDGAEDALSSIAEKGSLDSLEDVFGDLILAMSVSSENDSFDADAILDEIKEFSALIDDQQDTTRSITIRDTSTENQLKIPNMFTSGFETTPYSAVLPMLRANLEIPNEEESSLNSFSNISKLLVYIDDFAKLNSYLNFVSQFPEITGLPENIDEQYDEAYSQFKEHAFDAIHISLQAGKDIDTSIIKKLFDYFIGGAETYKESLLFKSLQEQRSYYEYITKVILSPENAKIWKSAPGGYLQVSFTNGTLKPFISLPAKSYSSNINKVDLSEDQSSKALIPDASVDILKIVKDLHNDASIVSSAMFPIFSNRDDDKGSLYFLQMIGPYIALYGHSSSVVAASDENESFDINSLALQTSKNDPEPSIEDLFSGDIGEGFESNDIFWGYALQPPKVSDYSNSIIEKFSLLTLSFHGNDTKDSDVKNNYKIIGNKNAVIDKNDDASLPQLIDIEQSNQEKTLMTYSACKKGDDDKKCDLNSKIYLLPINSTTTKYFDSAFSYSTDLSADEISSSTSFESYYDNVLFEYKPSK